MLLAKHPTAAGLPPLTQSETELCEETKDKCTRGLKRPLKKDKGRVSIYPRANNFVENWNQLL